jgi:pimeloyl-ACP methyl ester carboxylesterase
MVVFEKSTHMAIYEEPDKYLRVVRDFLSRSERRGAAAAAP